MEIPIQVLRITTVTAAPLRVTIATPVIQIIRAVVSTTGISKATISRARIQTNGETMDRLIDHIALKLFEYFSYIALSNSYKDVSLRSRITYSE